MNDNINDDLYLEAKKEIDNDNVDDTLWAKALANSEGSEETKALYIKYRSKKLNDNQNNNLDKDNDGFSAGIFGVIVTIIILLILFGI